MKRHIKIIFSLLLSVVILLNSGIVSLAEPYTPDDVQKCALVIKATSQMAEGDSSEFKIINLDTDEEMTVTVTDMDGVSLTLEKGDYKVINTKPVEYFIPQSKDGVKVTLPHVDENGNVHEVAILDMKASKDGHTDFVPIIDKDKTTVYVGDDVDYENIVTNLPDGAKITVKSKADTSSAGEKTAIITITFKNGVKRDFNIPITVKNKTTPTPPPLPPYDGGNNYYPTYIGTNLVEFDPNGGYIIGESSHRWYDDYQKVGYTPYVMAPQGLEFIGWSYQGILLSFDQIYNISVTKDMKFVAQYRPALLKSQDDLKYITGYPDKTFRPLGKITRAEMITIADRITEKTTNRSHVKTDLKYSDVKATDWYIDSLAYMDKFNIISGYEDGTFRPNDYITYKEFFVIVSRFTEHSYLFTDINWDKDFNSYMRNRGYLAGMPAKYKYDDYITREDAVKIINNMLEVKSTYDQSINFTDIDNSYAKHEILRVSKPLVYFENLR